MYSELMSNLGFRCHWVELLCNKWLILLIPWIWSLLMTFLLRMLSNHQKRIPRKPNFLHFPSSNSKLESVFIFCTAYFKLCTYFYFLESVRGQIPPLMIFFGNFWSQLSLLMMSKNLLYQIRPSLTECWSIGDKMHSILSMGLLRNRLFPLSNQQPWPYWMRSRYVGSFCIPLCHFYAPITSYNDKITYTNNSS